MRRRDDPRLEAALVRIEGWVRRWAGPVLRVMKSRMESEADAEDVVAETWRVILARWDRLPVDEVAFSWIVGIALNVARARSRAETRRIGWLEERGTDPGAPTHSEQPPVEAGLVIDAVWRVIDDLPDLQRRVFLARVLDGMSTKQAARAINRTEGTVKTSLFRALRRLKDELGDDVDRALEGITSRPDGRDR